MNMVVSYTYKKEITLKRDSVYTAAPTELMEAIPARRKASRGMPSPVLLPSTSPKFLN